MLFTDDSVLMVCCFLIDCIKIVIGSNPNSSTTFTYNEECELLLEIPGVGITIGRCIERRGYCSTRGAFPDPKI